ncbi:hypothetical protein OG21DRAFT_1491849 [Imleria badia]|nr:hypothetical protein OG21DRAFT_1491849 [Imleria badia]
MSKASGHVDDIGNVSKNLENMLEHQGECLEQGEEKTLPGRAPDEPDNILSTKEGPINIRKKRAPEELRGVKVD